MLRTPPAGPALHSERSFTNIAHARPAGPPRILTARRGIAGSRRARPDAMPPLDLALVSVMLYSFARVSAVIGMRRQDYFRQERRGGSAASTRCAPGRTCASRPRARSVRSARPVRRAATGNGATARSEAPASAKAAGNGYPLCLPPPRQSSTLHESCRYPLLGDPFHVFHWFQDFMRSTIFAICSFQSNRDSINSLVM